MKIACAVAIMTLILAPVHAAEPFGAATKPSQSAGFDSALAPSPGGTCQGRSYHFPLSDRCELQLNCCAALHLDS
jgi:hypothetical protein